MRKEQAQTDNITDENISNDVGTARRSSSNPVKDKHKARIQILDSTNSSTTAEFERQVTKTLLQNKIKTNLRKDTREVDIDIPLVLLVQNCTRIGTDIDAGLSCLKGNKIHPKLVAIIVIHAKEHHALPRVSAINRLNDERYADYGLLADFGFYEGNIYDCSLKRNGVESIIQFIKERSPCTSMSIAVNQEEAQTDNINDEDILKDVEIGHKSEDGPTTQSSTVKHEDRDVTEGLSSSELSMKKVRYSTAKRVQMLTSEITDSTERFKQDLEKKLQIEIGSCVKEDEFQPGVPIILLVQKMTEVEQDIKCALSKLKEVSRRNVAVVVIHINEPHALPSVLTDFKLPEEYDDLGLVVDFAYYKYDIYNHKMNTDSLEELSKFIQTGKVARKKNMSSNMD